MTPIRKTAEGLLITSGGVRFFFVVIGGLIALLTGVIGAVRFMATVVPTRTEFTEHLKADSSIHREQAAHSAFTDSMIRKIGTDEHATSCYNAKYPPLLCSDVQPIPRGR